MTFFFFGGGGGRKGFNVNRCAISWVTLNTFILLKYSSFLGISCSRATVIFKNHIVSEEGGRVV